MDNKKFEQELYEAHKLVWMLSHGYTVHDIVQNSSDALIDAIHESPDEQLDCIEFDWEENGFNGEIWPCLDEFMSCEFKDAGYIKHLISLLPPDRQKVLSDWYKDQAEEEYKLRCQDCWALVEDNDGDWACDETGCKCKDVEECPEGLSSEEDSEGILDEQAKNDLRDYYDNLDPAYRHIFLDVLCNIGCEEEFKKFLEE